MSLFNTLSLFLLHAITFSFLSPTHSQLTNQFETLRGPNGEDIWRSTSDFIPEFAKSFGSIRIGYEMSISFTFIWHGRTTAPNNYEQFFRIGFDSLLGNGCDGQSSHYPGLWIERDSDSLSVTASNDSKCSQLHSLSAAPFGPIAIETPYEMRIAMRESDADVMDELMHDIGGSTPGGHNDGLNGAESDGVYAEEGDESEDDDGEVNEETPMGPQPPHAEKFLSAAQKEMIGHTKM